MLVCRSLCPSISLSINLFVPLSDLFLLLKFFTFCPCNAYHCVRIPEMSGTLFISFPVIVIEFQKFWPLLVVFCNLGQLGWFIDLLSMCFVEDNHVLVPVTGHKWHFWEKIQEIRIVWLTWQCFAIWWHLIVSYVSYLKVWCFNVTYAKHCYIDFVLN